MKWKDGTILGLTLVNLVIAGYIYLQGDVAQAERKPIRLQDQVQNLEKRLQVLEEELKYKENEKISRIDYLEEELNLLKGRVDLLRARVEFLMTKTRIQENRLDRVTR